MKVKLYFAVSALHPNSYFLVTILHFGAFLTRVLCRITFVAEKQKNTKL